MKIKVNLIADIGIKKIDSILPLLIGFKDINIKYLDTESINSQSIIETDILLIRSKTIVDKMLLSNSEVGYIGSATAGIDHMDTHYLEKNNIAWFNAAGCNSASVCSYVLSCLYALSLNKNLNKSYSVGIFGYGNIGKKLKAILDNLNIKETLPIIKNCNVAICNDSSFSHLSSALGIKTITLMADTPLIYGSYSTNMYPIIPDGEITVSHDTLGKDKINPDKICEKLFSVIN